MTVASVRWVNTVQAHVRESVVFMVLHTVILLEYWNYKSGVTPHPLTHPLTHSPTYVFVNILYYLTGKLWCKYGCTTEKKLLVFLYANKVSKDWQHTSFSLVRKVFRSPSKVHIYFLSGLCSQISTPYLIITHVKYINVDNAFSRDLV